MAISETTLYQLSGYDLIAAALRKLGVLASGQTPDAEAVFNGMQALNVLLAKFRTMGLPLWARKTYSFTPTANVSNYDIGIGKTFNVAYPLHILQAYRQDTNNAVKVNMEVISNYNYNTYSTITGGTPLQLAYQPKLNFGTISLWPTPDATAATNTITIVYQAPFEYFNLSTDTLSFPEEWYLAIIYGLAVLLAPEWGTPLQDRQVLKAEAKEYEMDAKNNGQEDASMFVQPMRK